MSAQVFALRGVEPIAAPPPPALAHARRVAAALDLLGACAEDVSHLAATGDAKVMDQTVFSARMATFLDMMQLIAGR